MSAYQDYLLNNKSHNKRISKFISLIEEIFDVSTTQAIKMAESVNYDATKMFKFSDYPQLKGKVKAFVSEFQKQIKLTIVNGVAAEWEQSNINNTTLVNQLLMLQKNQ